MIFYFISSRLVVSRLRYAILSIAIGLENIFSSSNNL